jgi:hypothetical protein
MKTLISVVLMVALGFVGASFVYGATATSFSLPYSTTEPCTRSDGTTDIGYKEEPDQYFMEFNDDIGKDGKPINKYHMGEDWNGKCGGSSDFGDPLFAIADGTVQGVTYGTATDGIGNSIIIRYTLPDGKQIDSAYYHVNGISVNENQTVYEGQLIATIGDGNRQYPNQAHLHWEIRTNIGVSDFHGVRGVRRGTAVAEAGRKPRLDIPTCVLLS